MRPSDVAGPVAHPGEATPLGKAADGRDAGEPAPDSAGLHRFAIGESERGMRLDRFLASRCDPAWALSRTRLKDLVVAGRVTIDGRVETDPNHRLGGTDAVLDVPPAVPAVPQAQSIPLSIVHEDEHLLILDKPAGLVVHPAAGHNDGTLVNALIAHCGASLSGIGGVRRPGIVHRLDKDTTGLMVVAKTDAAHQGLSAIFADHGRSGSLERLYTAFVWAVPMTREGAVDRPLGRHPRDRERMAVVAEGRGRHAVTHWRLAERFGDLCAAIQCRLETGRTHQIRVHMASIGHPLIGDPVYAGGFRTKAARLRPEAQGAITALGRQALHAGVLGFEHPVSGEPLRFESPLPGDLSRLRSALREEGGAPP